MANLVSSSIPKLAREQAVSRLREKPRSLFRAWTEIRRRVRGAKRLALFLDFDGTLVELERRPGDVRLPERARRILQRLAEHPNVSIAVVSGRRLRDLQEIFGMDGVQCFGLHGAEQPGKKPVLTKKTRLALARAKREARVHLGILPGIWLEDKISSLAIHYRGTTSAMIREAKEALFGFLAPYRDALNLLDGDKVWEILPREFAGKGSRVLELLAGMPDRTLGIYVGDDNSDESAFAALKNHVTVVVGRRRPSSAQFRLQNPSEVLRFLARLEKELP